MCVLCIVYVCALCMCVVLCVVCVLCIVCCVCIVCVVRVLYVCCVCVVACLFLVFGDRISELFDHSDGAILGKGPIDERIERSEQFVIEIKRAFFDPVLDHVANLMDRKSDHERRLKMKLRTLLLIWAILSSPGFTA